MQLVGSACGRCSQRITSVVDGRFCDQCHAPVHHACTRPARGELGKCPGCGLTLAVGEAHRSQAESDEAETAAAIRPYHRFWGCVHLTFALLAFAYLALALLPFKRALFREEGTWGVPGVFDILVGVGGCVALARSYVHFRALRRLAHFR